MRKVICLAALVAAYIAAARLGLALGPGQAAPFWPATGLAIAALGLWGPRLWPAVAGGALAANLLFTAIPIPVAAGIALGHTLEALLGGLALRRLGVRGEVVRVRDAVAIVAVALLAPLAAATCGIFSLALGADPGAGPHAWTWLVWWLQDCVGALLVLPLLLAWAGARSPVVYPVRRLEFAVVLALAASLISFAYLRANPLGMPNMPFLPPSAFLFPPVLWAVLRLRPCETTLVFALASGLAMAFALAFEQVGGYGQFLWLQLNLLGVGGGALLMVGAIAERAHVEQALRESEQRLSGLVGVAMDAIISIDAEQRIVLFNSAAVAMFRCPEALAHGEPIDTFIPERFRARHREHVRQFVAEGTTARAMGQLQTLWGRRADGDEFPIEASISKVEVGGSWIATVIVRDITERFRAEQALRDSREHLALALKAGRSGTFDWDIKANQVSWSDELLALYGLRRKDFGGSFEDWLDCLAPEDRDAVHAAVQKSLRSGEFAMDFRVRGNDEIRWMHCRGEIFHDPAGEPARMLGINVDITERKRLEETLRQMNQELERRVGERTAELGQANQALMKSNQELRQFAYIASHDLQTPLRAITGCVQLLQKNYCGRIGEQADDLIRRVVANTHRIQTLIRDLLAYSSIESPSQASEPVDMGQVCREVRAELESVILETGATVVCEGLPVVAGNRSQLAQVMLNLIENGIKYRGEAAPRVEVSARVQAGEWLFSVRDNGIGIAPGQHARIFDIFARLHTQQAYPGTGIGLAICRRVIERHGGRIWVESAPGQGSVFLFTLPIFGSEATS